MVVLGFYLLLLNALLLFVVLVSLFALFCILWIVCCGCLAAGLWFVIMFFVVLFVLVLFTCLVSGFDFLFCLFLVVCLVGVLLDCCLLLFVGYWLYL